MPRPPKHRVYVRYLGHICCVNTFLDVGSAARLTLQIRNRYHGRRVECWHETAYRPADVPWRVLKDLLDEAL